MRYSIEDLWTKAETRYSTYSSLASSGINLSKSRYSHIFLGYFIHLDVVREFILHLSPFLLDFKIDIYFISHLQGTSG